MRGVVREVIENHYLSYATYTAKMNTWMKNGKYMHEELDGPTSYISGHFIIERSSSSMRTSSLSSYFALHYDKDKKNRINVRPLKYASCDVPGLGTTQTSNSYISLDR